jgi:hypothetical protein
MTTSRGNMAVVQVIIHVVFVESVSGTEHPGPNILNLFTDNSLCFLLFVTVLYLPYFEY